MIFTYCPLCNELLHGREFGGFVGHIVRSVSYTCVFHMFAEFTINFNQDTGKLNHFFYSWNSPQYGYISLYSYEDDSCLYFENQGPIILESNYHYWDWTDEFSLRDQIKLVMAYA